MIQIYRDIQIYLSLNNCVLLKEDMEFKTVHDSKYLDISNFEDDERENHLRHVHFVFYTDGNILI